MSITRSPYWYLLASIHVVMIKNWNSGTLPVKRNILTIIIALEHAQCNKFTAVCLMKLSQWSEANNNICSEPNLSNKIETSLPGIYMYVFYHMFLRVSTTRQSQHILSKNQMSETVFFPICANDKALDHPSMGSTSQPKFLVTALLFGLCFLSLARLNSSQFTATCYQGHFLLNCWLWHPISHPDRTQNSGRTWICKFATSSSKPYYINPWLQRVFRNPGCPWWPCLYTSLCTSHGRSLRVNWLWQRKHSQGAIEAPFW